MDYSQRVANLFKRTKKLPELSDSVVRHDRLDDGVLEDMIDRALHFRRAMFDPPEIDLNAITDEEGKAIELSDEEREKAMEYIACRLFLNLVFLENSIDFNAKSNHN